MTTQPIQARQPSTQEPAAQQPADPSADQSQAGRPGEAESSGPDEDLAWEQAMAFGIDGYDPEDPWNAVLTVEGETVATVLPLTPKHLNFLLDQLDEVRTAQRVALGAPSDATAGADRDLPVAPTDEQPAMRRLARAFRVVTGAEPVARLWQDSLRGRMTIIVGALIFIALGVILSINR